MGRGRQSAAPVRRIAPLLFVLVVAVVTCASAEDEKVVTELAASTQRLAQGRVWLLVTSGLLAERPFLASLLSFAMLAALTLAVCGSRVFWIAGLAGHVGSALFTYALIALGRLFDPAASGAAWSSLDYGVSAISAAWL